MPEINFHCYLCLSCIHFVRKKDTQKENLIKKKSVFGTSSRSGDYAQALMELGALICKPINPLCLQCPISIKCKSLQKRDFEITKNNKKQ